jgi:hypothetical protein
MVLVPGVPERQLLVHLVAVAPSVPDLGEVAGLLESLTICDTVRSVIPTSAAMSLRRMVGLDAMASSTCAWFVTNLQWWLSSPELDSIAIPDSL